MKHSRVKLSFVVEVTIADSWGDDCPMGQVKKQATAAALFQLNKALGKCEREAIVLEATTIAITMEDSD